MCVAFQFAPKGWAFCNGQLMAISQNEALFNLIGTIYGGDGTSNFALPDLRGRAPVHFGQGTLGENYALGQNAGALSTVLTVANLPAHNHQITCTAAAGGESSPGSTSILGTGPVYTTHAPTRHLANTAMTNTGGNAAFSIQSPIIAMNWVISLFGVFPTQS